jgi:hypothetical protein
MLRTATLSFVIPTRISCHAALENTACAPFRKERRMKCINALNLNRKSGGAKPRDLQFASPATKSALATALPFVIPSVAEGSAVPFLNPRPSR